MIKRLTFKIITMGCRVNQAESRMLAEQIVKLLNCQIVKLIKEANLIVLNTCCVTVKAEKEVRQTIRRIKKDNPKCFLVVTGCWITQMLRSTGSKSPRILDFIDLIAENKDKSRLAELIQQKLPHCSLLFTDSLKYHDKYANDKKTIIKIQDGCNNFCSYCIVPYVRGRSVSRPAEEILKEIRQKEKEGIEEVILTGIDLESFRFKIYDLSLPGGGQGFKKKIKQLELNNYNNDLMKLIRLILVETEIKKISFGSMGWDIIDREFIGLYSSDLLRSTDSKSFSSNGALAKVQSINKVKDETLLTKKKIVGQSPRKSLQRFNNETMEQLNNHLSSHFHIPLQSGCNGTLKRMNRRYEVKDIRHKIYDLSKNVPNFTFSTDLIVGFPGETEAEFKQTLAFIKEIKKMLGKNFTKIHIFRYSSRPGTLAAKMEGKQGWERIEEGEKQSRSNLLQEIFR